MPESSVHQSVTRLIHGLRSGRESAVGQLFEQYFERMVELARQRLQGMPGLHSYEEDVALRSFDSMCRRVRDPARSFQLDGRDDLWRLLATRTISRAIDLRRQHKPGEVPGEFEVEDLFSREPTAEEVAEMSDECHRLLDLLEEPELRQIALWKVEGFTHEEIAAKLDCVTRTVERKLDIIRRLWKRELGELP